MKTEHPFLYFTLRLFGYLCLSNFMGFSLLLTIDMVLSKYIGVAGDVITQLLSLSILTVFAYHCAWNEGFRDRNKINYGRETKNMFKGWGAGFLAVVPFYSMLLAVTVAFYCRHSVYALFRTCFVLLNASYVSIFTPFNNQPLVFALILLIYPVLAGFFYLCGLKDFWLSDKLIYKNASKSKGR